MACVALTDKFVFTAAILEILGLEAITQINVGMLH